MAAEDGTATLEQRHGSAAAAAPPARIEYEAVAEDADAAALREALRVAEQRAKEAHAEARKYAQQLQDARDQAEKAKQECGEALRNAALTEGKARKMEELAEAQVREVADWRGKSEAAATEAAAYQAKGEGHAEELLAKLKQRMQAKLVEAQRHVDQALATAERVDEALEGSVTCMDCLEVISNAVVRSHQASCLVACCR